MSRKMLFIFLMDQMCQIVNIKFKSSLIAMYSMETVNIYNICNVFFIAKESNKDFYQTIKDLVSKIHLT